MTNIEIDQTTGLPVLPEGFRWEVEPRTEQSGFYLYLKYKAEWSEYQDGYERYGFLWMRARKVDGDRWYTEESLLIGSGPDGYSEYAKILTPEAILETALKIYGVFMQERGWVEEHKKSAQYVGTYPPKSINSKS